MKCNVSPLDAAIRAGLGLVLLLSPLLDFRLYPYNYIGLVLFLTGAAGYCPFYAITDALFHASTERASKESGSHG